MCCAGEMVFCRVGVLCVCIGELVLVCVMFVMCALWRGGGVGV